MVVIGIAMEQSGLAAEASELLINSVHGLNPLIALIILYLLTMILTELLSNATVAVLITPVAVALADSLGVSPRPFLVAVMMAASAAFATLRLPDQRHRLSDGRLSLSRFRAHRSASQHHHLRGGDHGDPLFLSVLGPQSQAAFRSSRR